MIKKRYYNADHFDNGDGTITASIKEKWINYMEADDSWQPIDEHFEDTGTRFEMVNAPFIAYAPKLSTGTATFISNNRYDIWDKKKITDEPLTMTTIAEGVNEVAGKIETGDLGWGETTYIVYEGAYDFGDLIYVVHKARGTRLTRLVRFNETPSEDLAISFELSFDNKVKIRNNGKTWNKQGDLKTKDVISMRSDKLTNTSKRGIGLREFFIWDSSGGKTPVEVDIKKHGQGYTLTKNIPLSYFTAETVYPVYTDDSASFNPDANPESTSVDGFVRRGGTPGTWAEVRDGLGDSVNDSLTIDDAIRVISTSTNNQYSRIQRSIYLFDTSSLAGNDVDSANFKIYPNTIVDGFGAYGMNVVASTPASNTSLATSDYANTGTTAFSTSKLLSAMGTGAYETWVLNASGISAIDVNGVSKFATRHSADIANSITWASSKNDQVYAYYADNGSNEPELDVTYSASGWSGGSVNGVASASIGSMDTVAPANIDSINTV